eukprot:GHRR01007209.1.p1 GENE.GHRR01007209.1~~GHRR01007209.1.p1  ORF type:complete len:415 (+),score=158.20 GHRR01007209.1:266-1510(+)
MMPVSPPGMMPTLGGSAVAAPEHRQQAAPLTVPIQQVQQHSRQRQQHCLTQQQLQSRWQAHSEQQAGAGGGMAVDTDEFLQQQHQHQHQQQAQQQCHSQSADNSYVEHNQFSSQVYASQQEHQQLGMPANDTDAVAAAIVGDTGKKKSSKATAVGAPSSKKAKTAVAGSSATAYGGLWKLPGPPKEPRIVKEPGVEYEEVLPPGVNITNTRPLLVPAELFQLEALSSILNLDTWHNVLDDQDRAQLRALLPKSGEGFSEQAGGPLESLLSGSDTFRFGNPTDQLWQDMVTGAAAPRLRRQQELLLQLKQRLAEVDLRDYHNAQVSLLLAMQRLWVTSLPQDACTTERLAAWQEAAHGGTEHVSAGSPRIIAKRVRREAAAEAAEAEAAVAACNAIAGGGPANETIAGPDAIVAQ